MIHDDNYERALEPHEIEQRKNKALELLEEFDGLGSTIDQHQRQIRTLKLRQSTLDSRVRLLRHEVRSGKTLVDRQAELPYADTLVERPKDSLIARDTLAGVYSPPGRTEPLEDWEAHALDEQEEHDKPELTEGDLPDDYAKFAEMYPMASDPVKLTEQARRALGNTDYSAHLFDHVAKWHPSSVAFQETAHWARVECAHLDSEARGLTNPIPGLTIPAALPIPKSLQEALKLPQKKRAGARPLSSPSAALPAVAPVKKTRKRRSGSTQHSD